MFCTLILIINQNLISYVQLSCCSESNTFDVKLSLIMEVFRELSGAKESSENRLCHR